MISILTLKNKQRRTHIARGIKKGVLPKNTLCSCRFKWTLIKSVIEGNVESVTCKKCIRVLALNSDLFTKFKK